MSKLKLAALMSDEIVDCPCGGSNLHIRTISEKEKREVLNTKINTWQTLEHFSNQGVVLIGFDCECCGGLPVMVASGHKGSIFVGWIVREIEKKGGCRAEESMVWIATPYRKIKD